MLKYIHTSWLHLVLVYLAVLLDGSFALHGAQVLFRTPMSASPYFTIILIIMPIISGSTKQLSKRSLYVIAFLAGLLFDLFYNGVIGIAMIGFPLTVGIAGIVQRYFVPSFWSAMATWFISLSFYLIFDYIGFGIINVARLSIPKFIIFHMFPTLLVNLMLLIIFYQVLSFLYHKTRQPDIASYNVDDKSLAGQMPLQPRKK